MIGAALWASWTTPIIGAVVTAMAAGVKLLPKYIRSVRHRDHRTIGAGHFGQVGGGRDVFCVVVACAPSRAIARPHLPDARTADAFVAATFASHVPAKAIQATTDFYRYEDRSVSPAIVQLWSNGRVEALLPLPRSSDEVWAIDLQQAAAAFLALANSMQEGWYERLNPDCGRTRLDWQFTMAAQLSYSPDRPQGDPWLEFRGRLPAYSATKLTVPTCSNAFGGAAMWDRRASTPGRMLLRPALEDLLTQTGFREFDDAISDLLGADRLPSADGC